MKTPPIVSPQQWDAERERMLLKEKELTRARDALAAERRRMPWMAVEKAYRFEGPNGPASLLDVFAGRRQLIVYRFFYEPGVARFPERGCPGCSFLADQVADLAHLNARDTTLAFVSRAPQPDIRDWKARMGWEDIPWYTITDDFDRDFGVDECTAPTPSSARVTASSAPTSSTTAATRRWAAPGPTSTSPRSAARRSGRTRPRATPRRRPTPGGTGTTRTESARQRPAGRAPGEDAAAQEGALERVVAVHSAAAEAGDLAGRIEAGEGSAVGADHLGVEVGLEPAERLARADVQPDRDQRPVLGVEQLVGLRDPRDPVAAELACVGDRHQLEVLGVAVVDLAVARDDLASHLLRVELGPARDLVHAGDQLVQVV